MVVGVGDDSPTREISERAGIPFVAQEQAEGISAARNTGIQYSKTPFVAFIDDDSRPRNGWAGVLTLALADPMLAAVGGPVFDTRTGEQVVFPWLVDPFGVTHEAEGVQSESELLPVLNGCNMAFSRLALEDVGGFDPYYRYYYDETDLFVRLARSGYRIQFASDAIVDHDFADGPTRDKFVYYSSRMRTYFSMKNYRKRVAARRLLMGQARLLREDFRAYRLRRRHYYQGAAGALRAVTELFLGKLEGFVDGNSPRDPQIINRDGRGEFN